MACCVLIALLIATVRRRMTRRRSPDHIGEIQSISAE